MIPLQTFDKTNWMIASKLARVQEPNIKVIDLIVHITETLS